MAFQEPLLHLKLSLWLQNMNLSFQIGEFHSKRNSKNGTIINYSPKVNIDWPGNHKPVDEPHCGFDGGRCPRTKGRTEIAAGILGGEDPNIT